MEEMVVDMVEVKADLEEVAEVIMEEVVEVNQLLPLPPIRKLV